MLLPVCSGLISIVIATYALNRLQFEYIVHKHSMERVLMVLAFEEKLCILFTLLNTDFKDNAEEGQRFATLIIGALKTMRADFPAAVRENPRLALYNDETMELCDNFVTVAEKTRLLLKKPLGPKELKQLRMGFFSIGLASRTLFGAREEAEDWLQNNSLANLHRQELLFLPFLLLSNALTLAVTWLSISIFNGQIISPLNRLKKQIESGRPEEIPPSPNDDYEDELDGHARRTAAYLERSRHTNNEIVQLDNEIQTAFIEISHLHQSELAIVQYSGDVLCSLNANGLITRVNKSCEVFWGYPAESLIGASVENLIAEPFVAPMLKTLNRAKLEGGSRSVECQHLDVSGIETFFLWTMHWVAAEKEFLCVCHDITQKHQMQSLRENICSTLSHDMRTPLMSMSTSIELLAMKNAEKNTPREATLLKDASQLSQKLIKLVTDVLDWKKIESGNIGVAESRIPALELSVAVAERLEALYPVVSTDIISEHKSTISGDRDLLTRSLISIFEILIERVVRSQQFNLIISEEFGKTTFIGYLPDATNDGDFSQSPADVTIDSNSIMELNLPMSFYLVENIIRSHGGSISLIIDKGFVQQAKVSLPQSREIE